MLMLNHTFQDPDIATPADTETLKSLLKDIDKPIKDNLNAQYNNVLHFAAKTGQLPVVKQLLELGADVDARNNNHSTALVLAAKNGHIDVVGLLLIPTNLLAMREALVSAAKFGRLNVLNLLLTHIAGSDQCAIRDAFIAAAENGHTAIVKLLLRDVAGFDDTAILRKEFSAPGQHHLLSRMLCAHVNKSNNSAIRRAFICTAGNGHIDTLQLLLEHGNGIIDASAIREALIRAASCGRIDEIQLLLQHGAGTDASAIQEAIQLAKAKNYDIIVELLSAQIASQPDDSVVISYRMRLSS